MAFTDITQLTFTEKQEQEYIWQGAEHTSVPCFLAGSLLGSEIIRVRLVRMMPGTHHTHYTHYTHQHAARYQLADGGPGTLPYHSWIVAKGDEQWPDVAGDDEARTILEPYLQGFACSPAQLRLSCPLASEECIYGLGERTGSMDKRGQTFPIWNSDPHRGHNKDTVTMYTSIPFYLALHRDDARMYGVLIDTTGKVEMDIGHTIENELRMTVQGDSLVAYFFRGPTAADVLRQYTELTGHIQLPQRWTLGNHQCRWGYTSGQQIRALAQTFRTHHQPCDAFWLDIDYMKGYRNFTWNTDAFPEPEQMIHDLHEQGFHLITIIDPGTKIDENYFVYQEGMERDYFCRYENGELFKGNVWPGACVFPDFSRTGVREWWGNLYKGLLDQGVDGIWNDMDEPALTNMMMPEEKETKESKETDEIKTNTMDDEVLHRADGDQPAGPDGLPVLHKFFHNAYGMEMARSTYNGLLRLRPNSRPFILTRSGTAGMQRYAAVWTGDNWSRWPDILMAIPMCLNISMSGVPFVGIDIGGFWESPTGELLVRFAQLGALLPFCRNHSATGTHDQEPWAFGEPYESAYRMAIETRYRLLPYLYTLFHEASINGAPVIRPLYYHYANDEQAINVDDELLIGDRLLSAPIYTEGATSREVYLPEGQWFDYWDGTEYPGSTVVDIAAPLERWPLLVRGNSILPTGPLMQYIDQQPTNPLTFTCYMATDDVASYTLYTDDGTSQNYKNGESAEVSISCRLDRDVVTVRIDEQFEQYRPQWEEYEIVVYAAGRTLREKVKAGQGSVVVRL